MNRNKSLFYFAAFFAMVIYGISTTIIGAILPQLIDKFRLTGYSAGTVASSMPLGITIGSIIFGPIVDRFGYKLLMFVASITVITGLYGLSSTSSVDILRISVLLIGAGNGIINGTANSLVSDISGEKKKSRLSLLHAFYGIGALGLPFMLSVFSSVVSIREVFLIISISLFLLALLLVFITFPVAKKNMGLPLSEILKLINNPLLLLFAFFLFFQSGMEGVAGTWITTLIQKTRIDNYNSALAALFFLILALTIGRFLISFLLKHFTRFRLLQVGLIIVISGAVIIFSINNYYTTITGLVLMGFGFAGGFPIILSFVGDNYQSISGTAFSLIFVIALSGSMIMNIIAGVISDTFGIQYISILIIACVFIMFFLLYNLNSKMSMK
ncbi:MAG: MFS transporter [Ignavibacteriaceae bacterium]|jgi:fucose permease|nr:MFS transporter [Ignavibacteriaceae bacterium]